MALVRTNRIGSQSSTGIGTGSYTTASFTPSNSSLLVATAFSSSGGTIAATNLTIADSLGTLTWTSRLTVTHTAGSEAARIWTAPVGTGASMTVTIDAGTDSTDEYSVVIVDYTGYDTTTPTGATASSTAAGLDGAVTITLSGAPATTSEVIAYYCHDNNSVGTVTSSPGASWTEIYDFDTSGHSGMEAEIITGSSSTTVAWTDVDVAGAGVFRSIALAIEVVVAAAGTDPFPAGYQPARAQHTVYRL